MVLGIAAFAVFTLYFQQEPERNQDLVSPTLEPSPSADVSPIPADPDNQDDQDDQEQIPDNWTHLYDGIMTYRIAYPVSWTISPAATSQGESAVQSFDPGQTPDVGGVPRNEIKVAVVFFAPGDERKPSFEDSTIVSEKPIQVGGFDAIQRVTEGGAGGSVSTEVTTPQGTYFISAYPPDSELISTYQQILDYIDLTRQPPVKIDQPPANMTITSPATVSGSAPGTWFSEAVLPISLKTYDGEILAEQTFMTEQDWMTTRQLQFSTQFEFIQPDAEVGYISIERNNPSGIPRNQTIFTWPVEF